MTARSSGQAAKLVPERLCGLRSAGPGAPRLPVHVVRTLAEARQLPVFARRARAVSDAAAAARRICASVAAGGDAALRELTRRIDGVEVTRFRLSEEEVSDGASRVAPGLDDALRLAAERIRRFHERTAPPREIPASDGLVMRREFRPLDSVGLYVPGGTAAYPSSVLMLAIPAQVAGVRRVALVTPPGVGGGVPPAVLCAARLAGVTEVHRVGGAQAIAALAYGTESIAPVDLVAGPGNRWVTAAKRLVFGRVAIDGLAGPSEIAVIGDGSTPLPWSALDVLAQLEHDHDARALVTGTDAAWIEAVVSTMAERVLASTRRRMLEQALAASAALLVPDLAIAATIVNAWAPEHLAIQTSAPERLVPLVPAAGAVFLGAFAPVAVGDYLAGPNHVLPTGGTARSFSGLGVETFGRWVAVVQGDERSLGPLLEPAARLADAEGLEVHSASLRARRQPDAGSRERVEASGSTVARSSVPLSRRAERFEPYRTARESGAEGILLDANENPAGGLPADVDLADVLRRLGRYPDPHNLELRAAAASVFGVGPESVFAGNGSDEAVDRVFAAFTDPGDDVVVAVPTYGLYALQAALHGVEVRPVALRPDFRLDPAALLPRCRDRVLFLCSPNNPTGNLLGRRAILEAADRFPGIVVVDEAYIEFAGVPSLTACAASPGSSLLVLRTLSKAWGLAGLRVGFAVGEAATIAALQKVKLPYNLSSVVAVLAQRALSDPLRVEEAVRRNAAERTNLVKGLEGLGLQPLPSSANFVLVPHRGASALVSRLARDWRIAVRDRSGLPGLASAFRVTVGTRHENDRFLEALAQCLA